MLLYICSAAMKPNVLPERDESSCNPCAVIEAYIGPIQDNKSIGAYLSLCCYSPPVV